MIDRASAEQVAEAVIAGLAAGQPVEIEGLGVFHPDATHGFRFESHAAPKAFLAYVREDLEPASLLYDALADAGFAPWMDLRKLAPGQNWPRGIESAIEAADFFLACFSARSVNKRGGFQAEIRYALDCARRVPLDEIFIIPVRLDECRVPRSIQREWQYIDLFPDWDRGVRAVTATIRREWAKRRRLCRWPGVL